MIAFANKMFNDTSVVITERIEEYTVHDNVLPVYFFGGWCGCCLTVTIVSGRNGDGINPTGIVIVVVIVVIIDVVVIIVLETGRNLGEEGCRLPESMVDQFRCGYPSIFVDHGGVEYSVRCYRIEFETPYATNRNRCSHNAHAHRRNHLHHIRIHTRTP